MNSKKEIQQFSQDWLEAKADENAARSYIKVYVDYVPF